ncbi:hypothetical protein FG167_12475 [Lacinutrix sp. WUR7]|uniref:hypothetical protein n=1 Tax=Lacinutrix sp. WUR7 TaxID=2653681 RepID=UPI00193CAA55|nr:hypothetical protein [Lacinutrix sp. WUR7]QRM90009.1 hypothetical protein FG167_12475 [Lacinutrix sp. WUR7]
MEILGKLFGRDKLKITDTDFGEIESFSTNGNRIGWLVNRRYLDTDVEILIDGNIEGLFKEQKEILLQTLNNESAVKLEAGNALKEQYENAELAFISLDTHFQLKGISVNTEGFEMIFQEKEGKNYFFSVHFKNNKQIGVSIDG